MLLLMMTDDVMRFPLVTLRETLRGKEVKQGQVIVEEGDIIMLVKLWMKMWVMSLLAKVLWEL